MLKQADSISYQHKLLLDNYTAKVLQVIKACTGKNESKYNDFVDIANLIISHHNTYKHDFNTGNFYDFMSIIPTNLSVAVQGFLAGIETKRNAVIVRGYRFMLTDYAYKLVEDLDKIKLYNE